MPALSIDQLSEIYRKASSCPANKVPHHSLDLAEAAAEKQNEKERMFVAPRLAKAYRCPYCSMWHVGRSRA